MIECNEISQTVNYLLTAFQDCKNLKAADMQLLVQLIAAVNTCANGGPNYSTVISETYNPEEDQLVIYPPNTFHSISVVVLSGTILYDTGAEVSPIIPAGSSINIELTTLNQQNFTFTVTAGSNVLVEYIVETIE